MRSIKALAALLLLASLAACNTVGGLGQDIEAGGDALTDSARETEAQL